MIKRKFISDRTQGDSLFTGLLNESTSSFFIKTTIIATILIIFILAPLSFSQQDITEFEKRLERISEQIKNLREKIKEEEERKSSLLSQLGKIGIEKKLIQSEISLYNLQLKKANNELTSIRKSIPPLKEKLEKEKKSIEKILVSLYRFGRFNYLEFMLQVKDMGNLISESKNLTLLAQYQEKIVNQYRETWTQLKTAEENQEKKTEEITQLISMTQEKRKDLLTQERQNRTFVREITNNRMTYLKTIDELKDRTEQLQVLIDGLVRQEISLPFTLIPLYEKQGFLLWPLEGKIVTSFGLERHPQFKTETVNNGIEISPQKNTTIKSIHPGVVVYNDYFEGYGNLIIIDHGMTYYSLYGHCSDFKVKKGDVVQAEQPIAEVGDIGSLKGTTLYFEIRYKTKPVNPLQWLKQR